MIIIVVLMYMDEEPNYSFFCFFFSRVTGEFIASLTVDAVLKLCKSNSILY